jgi:hypothetical protein
MIVVVRQPTVIALLPLSSKKPAREFILCQLFVARLAIVLGGFIRNPRRFIGEIDGQYLYTYRAKHRLPIIVTYGNYNVSEGVLFTYVVTNGKYKRIRQQYPIDVQNRNGHSMPRFLENATRQCKDYGL